MEHSDSYKKIRTEMEKMPDWKKEVYNNNFATSKHAIKLPIDKEIKAMTRREEIEAVQRLGEAIGYGNMMDIASALWANKLQEKHGISSGAFVPTVPILMKDKEAEQALKRQQLMMEQVKKELD